MNRIFRKVLNLIAASALLLCLGVGVAAADDGTDFVIGLATIAIILYLIPTWIAFIRRHPNRWPIAVVNIALGATGLGWLGSLVWAMSAVHRSTTGNHGGESGLNLFVNDHTRVPMLPLNSWSPVAASMKSSDELSSKLLQLKKLRDNGAVSSDEYAALREPIIRALMN